jgi:hypothetical protein
MINTILRGTDFVRMNKIVKAYERSLDVLDCEEGHNEVLYN